MSSVRSLPRSLSELRIFMEYAQVARSGESFPGEEQLEALEGASFRERALLYKIRQQRLTYLSFNRLYSISSEVRRIEEQKIEGCLIEAGCALGGSSCLMALQKLKPRPLLIYDVFGMIPSPTADDGDDVHERYKTIKMGKSKGIMGDPYYGYQDDLYGKVRATIESFGINLAGQKVEMLKGLLQDTLQVSGPVAFAHIDVDWYDPVFTSLKRIVPRLSVGGSIILDDYNDWSGCKDATDNYFADKREAFTFDDTVGSMKIVRVV